MWNAQCYWKDKPTQDRDSRTADVLVTANGKINQNKIVGGHKVAPKWKYPWMVAITAWRRKDKRWKHICGGALISSRHILTASHCFPTSLK